jgi:spore photoproduct lyase
LAFGLLQDRRKNKKETLNFFFFIFISFHSATNRKEATLGEGRTKVADLEREGKAKRTLLDVSTIYLEPAVREYARGREILEQFPQATLIEVPSHWNIPGLNQNEENAEDWNKVKRTTLVLGVKKGLQIVSYYRSADFIAPSQANGCAMACAYCYVARRKGFANPISTFVNIEQICGAIKKHAAKQGLKMVPTQPDPKLWVYELGTNSDCSVDAIISNNVRDIIAMFRELPNAKVTFATKFVNHDLLSYDPQGHTRIRFSLMPQSIARIVDVRTGPIQDRIEAIDDFIRAGYEVNLNFGPVLHYEGWLEDYARLFEQLDATLSVQAKKQLQAEVIFLTHSEQLHEVNLKWHPKAEELLWKPTLQETKISGTGGINLRYKMDLKWQWVSEFRQLLSRKMPYCQIRYAF